MEGVASMNPHSADLLNSMPQAPHCNQTPNGSRTKSGACCKRKVDRRSDYLPYNIFQNFKFLSGINLHVMYTDCCLYVAQGLAEDVLYTVQFDVCQVLPSLKKCPEQELANSLYVSGISM